VLTFLASIGRHTARGVAELGYNTALLAEGILWTLFGRLRKQPVRLSAVFAEAMEIGVRAVPIISVLSFTIGLMLAMQGIDSLRTFGAEDQVVLGIALSITREFASLITGIVVAGRSGSALAARIGTMQVSQEIDALRVIGIDPVRYLAAPALLAMVLVLPCLTFLAMVLGLLGGALFSELEIGLPMAAYIHQTLEILVVGDIGEGLSKSLVFAVLIATIGVSNGFSVHGGAEGVGRATTRAVVQSITTILIADMAFTYFLIHT
jgi:phospholipid/cholesterol/gamma-HCH transport system permease protein